jgi:glycine betaine/proline transport system ATP-binding protein
MDDDTNAVGTLDMRDLVKALVPRISSSEVGTRYH